MQLLLGLKNTWKCIDVELEDGCTPRIGGVALKDCNIEPASWFKVLVLDSVCVDCSEHVISWNVAPPLADTEGHTTMVISQAISRRIALESSSKLGRSSGTGANLEVPREPTGGSCSFVLQSQSASDLTAAEHCPQPTSNSAPCTPRPKRSTQPNKPSPLTSSYSSQPIGSVKHDSPSPLTTSCPPQPTGNSQPDGPSSNESSLRSLSLQLQSSPGAHSLMAPHEGEASLCQDDLSSLFELAEVLFRVNPSYVMHARGQEVEQRSWLRLLHCFILPLISLYQGDISAVERAHTVHQELLAGLDHSILENSSEVMKMKQELVALRGQLMPVVRQWVESGWGLPEFLSLFSADLRQLEEEARNKIQSALKNMDLFRKLSTPISEDIERRLIQDRQTGQTQLMETLELRGAIERMLSLRDFTQSLEKGAGQENEVEEMQRRYIETHRKLAQMRQLSAEISKKKVLALSVREALDQTLESLHSGRITTGIDVGLQGGHSTDVLAEASLYAASEEYTTLRDKIQRLLQVQSSPASLLHHSFCVQLRQDHFPLLDLDFVMVTQPISQESFQFRAMTMPTGTRKSPKASRHWSLKSNIRPKQRPVGVASSPPIDLQKLAESVREHFEKVVAAICDHFNDHEVDFLQQVWLCYERLFFEGFTADFLPLYQNHHAKFCEQLQLNSLSSSIVDPQTLNLAVTEEVWLDFFQPRPFEEVVQLYQELTDDRYLKWNQSVTLPETELWRHFGGVASDLFSLPPAISPLEKLQLLTSAFRKSMATLSELKAKPKLADLSQSSSSMDMSQMGVSCDDLLPLLVLVLLQLPPSFLANLFLHCCFLDDYMAPFLSAGWHGYSLAAFRSALQIIAEL